MLTWHDLKFFFLRFADNVGVMATQPTLLRAIPQRCWPVWPGWAGSVWRLDRAAILAADRRGQWVPRCWPMLLAAWSGNAVAGRSPGARTRERLDPRLRWANSSGRCRRSWRRQAASPHWLPPVATRRSSQAGCGSAWPPRPRRASCRHRAVPAGEPVQSGHSSRVARPTCATPRVPALAADPRARPDAGARVRRRHVAVGIRPASGVPHLAFGPAGDFAPFTVAPGIRAFLRPLPAGRRLPHRGRLPGARRDDERPDGLRRLWLRPLPATPTTCGCPAPTAPRRGGARRRPARPRAGAAARAARVPDGR